VTGSIRSIEKCNYLVRYRTRDLPACSMVPRPTTLPRGPVNSHAKHIKTNCGKMERCVMSEHVQHVVTAVLCCTVKPSPLLAEPTLWGRSKGRAECVACRRWTQAGAEANKLTNYVSIQTCPHGTLELQFGAHFIHSAPPGARGYVSARYFDNPVRSLLCAPITSWI
jgi:hypothetical protein